MTDRKKPATAEEEALKALIRATVMNAGPIEPDAIPHAIKERIRGHASGDLDVDAYIRAVIKEAQTRSR